MSDKELPAPFPSSADADRLDAEATKLTVLTGQLHDLIACGKPPGIDWVRAFRAYEQSVTRLLAERRARSKLLSGHPDTPMSDDEYEAELDSLVDERIRKWPLDRITDVLWQRAGGIKPARGGEQ
jgi:hypothetical protein